MLAVLLAVTTNKDSQWSPVLTTNWVHLLSSKDIPATGQGDLEVGESLSGDVLWTPAWVYSTSLELRKVGLLSNKLCQVILTFQGWNDDLQPNHLSADKLCWKYVLITDLLGKNRNIHTDLSFSGVEQSPKLLAFKMQAFWFHHFTFYTLCGRVCDVFLRHKLELTVLENGMLEVVTRAWPLLKISNKFTTQWNIFS